MLLEKKKPSIQVFYRKNKHEIDTMFEILLNNLNKINVHIYNVDLFYQDYVRYVYHKSAYI